ncbi:MAG: hypothetical protein NTY63_00150, partial [Candidatus Bipolaricaulota bacterium]|nr:hypothetical protein [Candidatus Bipolaricaulota bacterium]
TLDPNMRLGTLPYMAPEMFEPSFREMLDYRSDLYAAAVTVYELAAGVHPIVRREDGEYATLLRIAQTRPVPLASHRADLPVAFCRLVDQLMRKLPALRPSNVEDLMAALEVAR